jgi:hypothetical protein
MACVKYLLLVFWFAPALFAQQFSHPVMASRDDASSGARVAAAGTDTIRLLAVRVQFQTDTDSRTTGNGRFDLTAGTDSSLDAPPHDAQYFGDHLTFLVNYFRKTSRGRTVVLPTLLDSVVTLPAPMAAYSPPKAGPNTAVANLARDTWRRVDSLALVADFRRFNCFLLFHAGAGRDIDLVGTLGYDPTPFDIPSLYFGLNAFRQAYGSSYQGIPVSGGSFFITNTVVLPETERRLLPGVTGDVPLLLGVNGLLCASFGNFLGLPDLFDTGTGRSGIGRFGLMDGQAIFSFAGLFPPEPSAWEKYWLGWLEPITVGSTPSAVALPAVGFGGVDAARADTVYRVPISGSEYFLLENRNRDPEQNGVRVVQSLHGSPRTLSVRHDTTGFEFFDCSRIVGVVTDVEDFDWSLPGGLEADGTFYDGGLLIWHIDESIIRSRIAANGVNADPLLRGVDLEEADGSQDIGQQYDAFTAASGSEEGTVLDFWFRGNSAPVYKNEFSPTTFPATTSNNGGKSQITIADISPRGPRMSARISFGAGGIRPLPGFPKRTGEVLTDVPLAVALSGGSAALVLGTTGLSAPSPRTDAALPAATGEPKVFAWRTDGRAFLSGGFGSGLIARDAVGASPGGLSLADVDGDGILEITRGLSTAQGGGRIRSTSLSAGTDSLGRDLLNVGGPVAPGASSGVSDSLLTFLAGKLYLFGRSGAFVDSIALPGDSVVGVTQLPAPYSFVLAGRKGTLLLTARGRRGVTVADVSRNLNMGLAGPVAAAPIGSGGSTTWGFALVTSDGRLFLLDNQLNTVAGYPVDLRDSSRTSPVLADIDGDGARDIVAASRSSLHVFNRIGVELDGFPVRLSSSAGSAPIVADVDGDGHPDVVVVSVDGVVTGVDHRGKVLSGFPLSAGWGKQWPAAFLAGDSICLAVASSEDGSVSAWRTGSLALALPGPTSLSAFAWPQYQHDPARSGSDAAVLAQGTARSEFFPASRAYNWPNPAYGGTTYLRYYVGQDAGVSITIFDLAGDCVGKYSQNGVGGVDNEFAWDVSGIQSGIYFARIEARGAQETGVALVKIAVVK